MTNPTVNTAAPHQAMAANRPAGAPATAREAPTSERALMVAWMVSVAAHFVFFAAMLAIPWIARNAVTEGALEAATTELLPSNRQVNFSVLPATSPFQQTKDRPKPESTHVSPESRDSLSELSRIDKPKLAVIGIGTGGGEFSKHGIRVGLGDRGPQFFGIGGDARAARRIVYIVDRSGSMLGVFEDLRKELKRSINRLRKSQKFHVIFYSTDPPIESPPKRLVNAIRASKEEAFDFIDTMVPDGMTQPIEAMRRAFQLKPDLIYFLSDGEIPEAAQLIEDLHEWNHEEAVRIFTIAYVNSAGRDLLERIARENNGQFRFVSEYDLD